METAVKAPPEKAERNMGIELLRAVSMLLVVVLHLNGSILPAENGEGSVYELVWLVEAAAFCAVNCFAMISGYVGAGAAASPGKALGLWLQTAFYTLTLTAVFAVARPEYTDKSAWLCAVSPVLHGQYWYISAYFGLMLVMPVLERGVKNVSSKALGAFFAGMLLYICAAQYIGGVNTYAVLSGGYSLIWLIFMYIAGAYLKRSRLLHRGGPWAALLAFAAAVAVTWGLRMTGRESAVNYTFPTVVLAAAALTVFFAKLKIESAAARKVVAFLSAGSLGVYLIHIHPLFYRAVTGVIAVGFPQYGGILCVLFTLLAALGLFLACEAADAARRFLFRLLRLDRAGKALDRLLSRYFSLDKG